MVSKRPNIWKWLPLIALGLMALGAFAPLADPQARIVYGVGVGLLGLYVGTNWWGDRRKRQADQSSSAAISSSDQT
jgi:hypothetical protein